MSSWFILAIVISVGVAFTTVGIGARRYWRIRPLRQATSQHIGERDPILEAVRFAATEFLKSDNWEHSIESVLVRLHAATQASRIHLYQRITEPDGTLLSQYRFGYPPESDDFIASVPTITVDDLRPVDLERLLSGEMVVLTPLEMKGNLLNIAQQRGTKTTLVMPIMVDGELWGVMNLTSDHERVWKITEREALHAAADILGAAILRQHHAEALLKREKILEAVSYAARQFLRTGDWEQHIQTVLEQLGTATKVSRVYIFSVAVDGDNTGFARLRYSWTADGIPSQIDNPNLQSYPLSKRLPRIYNHLRQREVIYGVVSEFAEEERIAFRTTDILSIMMVPIIVANRLWGIIGFDECTFPRQWTSAEREALKAAAEIIGGGIQRDEHDRMLQENSAQLSERNKDLEAFNHTIAHDLRSPLHTITNALNMLRQRYVTELSQEAIETLINVEIRSKQLLEMIDQLWWLTRLHDPSEEIMPVEIDLAVHSALVRYAERIQDSGITVNIADNLPLALGHWRWVVEVFANLISNAIKFVDPDKSDHRIDILAKTDADMVRFSVIDNGIGISQVDQHKIFEMFERLDRSRSTGSGLGLPLVRRMVSKMGGEVGVESSLGEGSTFWFTLPACPPSYLL